MGFGGPPPPPGGGYYDASRSASYSSWGKRVGAYFVRSFTIAVPANIASALLKNSGAGVIIGLVLGIVSLIFSIRSLIQRGHLGYDFGDAVVGQRLVRDGSGQPMGSGWNVFARQFAHIVDTIICGIGWLFPLWDKKRQTIGDKIMSTVVVDHQPQHSAGTLIVNALQVWTKVLKA
jgi:hypothetical protein